MQGHCDGARSLNNRAYRREGIDGDVPGYGEHYPISIAGQVSRVFGVGIVNIPDGGRHLWTGFEIRNLQGHTIDPILRRVNLRTDGTEHIAVEPGGGGLQVVLNLQLIATPAGNVEDLVDGPDQDAAYHRDNGQNQ
jgi:hypothetical protein